jgi:hypothetical protein
MKSILFSILASICVSSLFAQNYPNDYAIFVPYNRMSHSTNGNIGIGFGFNNPQSLLHINGDFQANGKIRINDGDDFLRMGSSNANNHSFIQFGDNADDQLRFQYTTYQNGNLVDKNIMTITSYGNVGIGTLAPPNALTIDTGIETGFQLNGTSANYAGITVNAVNPSGNPRYAYSTQGFEVVRHEYDDVSRSWNLAMRPFGNNFFKTAITVGENGKVIIPNLEAKSPFIVSTDASDAIIAANVNNTTGISKYSFMRSGVEQSSISYNTTGGLYFSMRNSGGFTTAMAISPEGNVGIGTASHLDLAGGFKLSVKGKMVSEQAWVLVQQDWPDYVFADDYALRSLDEVKAYIKTNHHLPEVPSAATIEADGVNMGAMHVTMMKKIEELTLYLIEVKEELEAVKKEVNVLREENKKLSTESNSK